MAYTPYQGTPGNPFAQVSMLSVAALAGPSGTRLVERPSTAERLPTPHPLAPPVDAPASSPPATPLIIELEDDRIVDVSETRKTVRLQRGIGAGGYAVVLAGECLATGASLAVKIVVTGHMAPGSRARKLVEAEMRLHQHLHDSTVQAGASCVVPFVDGFQTPEYICIMMPLCEDGSLADLIEEWVLEHGQGLPRKTVYRLMVLLGQGTKFIHDSGVFHRDLKAANVLMQGGWPLITDFGVSVELQNAPELRTGVVGSFPPPELLRSKPLPPTYGKADAGKVDAYALGVLACAMFLGVAHPAIYWAPSPEEWDAVVSVIDNDHDSRLVGRLWQGYFRTRCSVGVFLKEAWSAEVDPLWATIEEVQETEVPVEQKRPRDEAELAEPVSTPAPESPKKPKAKKARVALVPHEEKTVFQEVQNNLAMKKKGPAPPQARKGRSTSKKAKQSGGKAA